MEKTPEVLSQEKALHRILFNANPNDALVRYWRWRLSKGIMSISLIEKILIQNGYTKVQSSQWTK